MWLPYCLLGFVSIAQLVLGTNAAYVRPSPDLLCPYDAEQGSFLKEVREHATGASASCSSCVSVRTNIDQDTLRSINYFKSKFKKSDNDQDVLVQKLFRHLLQTSLPPNVLKAWVTELASIIRQQQGTSKSRTSIVYGIHTLLLARSRQSELADEIRAKLSEIKGVMCPPREPLTVLHEWLQELCNPAGGLSDDFRSWDFLKPMLMHHPELVELYNSARNYKSTPPAHLNKVVNLVFAQSSKHICAQTRIVLIALLFHLMYTDVPSVNRHVSASVTSLASNPGGQFFLFEHETTLVMKLLADYNSDYPGAPRPNGRTTILTRGPPRINVRLSA
ncbi:hypothetical protein MJO29_001783 [Puccinia striiformis f. sp. tritici]|uniref:Uncharacterized protein n=1 Tax=Puccinia striiformis f. sp. tritici PST-78 TaxID=1165861 RepID=A0A0L0W5A4_9BASI|nr:hypothetical protein Pst134EB_004092 [Puccinia striiformis f. sp. tritici]KAI7966035.1 hypothetical protein MJO29_001783 [Puccinia striiformis f. sp. tritici]KNF06435.1 hypothetical protein PSTG_00318 [Puccinia striiformis f. sp. tritici PST-78]